MKTNSINRLADDYRRQHMHKEGLSQADRDRIDLRLLEDQHPQTLIGARTRSQLLRWLKRESGL